MTDHTDHNALPEDDGLAAEYVLGLLAPPQRHEIVRRLARDTAFAALVARWETQLMPLNDDIAPVQPPHEVWTRINAALPAQREPRPAGLAFWRGWAIGASGLALASLAALFFVLKGPESKPLVATIGGGTSTFVATFDPRLGSVVVVPAATNIPADRVAELWLIPADGKPRSLGLLRADRPVTLALSPNLAGQATPAAVLAVSLEPPGGSPTGAPTGPVIGQGKLINL